MVLIYERWVALEMLKRVGMLLQSSKLRDVLGGEGLRERGYTIVQSTGPTMAQAV